MRLAWADPERGAIDYTKLSDIELAGIARGREALAVFGWIGMSIAIQALVAKYWDQ